MRYDWKSTSIGEDTFTWEAGRRLSSITENGITTTFTYDANGYRTAKATNGVTTTYYLDGSRITAMKVVNAEGSHELSFVYDEKGSVVGLYHNGTPYVYAKNLQGDIIGIVDGTGTWVVNYTYDAWGNPITIDGTLASTLGTLNPFRYRGYVYDTETGYYYLTSRYYSPEMGRFLNADIFISTGVGILQANMFAYCEDNPVNADDPSGYFSFWDILDVGVFFESVVEFIKSPSWSKAGDVGLNAIGLAPVFPSAGITKKAVNIVDDAVDTAKAVEKVQSTAKTIEKGWKVGDDISNLTKAGNVPSWSTVRKRFWKNEAFYNPSLYSDNLERVKKGLAPIGDDGFPMELHHIYGRKGNNFFVFEPMTRTQHRNLHYGD